MTLQNNARSPNYWVILPTYCEAENLPEMLDRLNRLDISGSDLNILVVDDNSPDRTGEIAASYSKDHPNIHLLQRITERGLGSAYLAGFNYALTAGGDFMITMDCDFSHEPEALPSLIAALDGAGCVVGSRYVTGGRIENWPKRRKILSASANRFVRLLFGMPIRDCTSGYRIYRRQIIEDILAAQPRSQGYSFLVEALRTAVAGPLPVRESPIRFVERTAGNSKMGLREVLLGGVNLLSLRARLFFKTTTRPQTENKIENSVSRS